MTEVEIQMLFVEVDLKGSAEDFLGRRHIAVPYNNMRIRSSI